MARIANLLIYLVMVVFGWYFIAVGFYQGLGLVAIGMMLNYITSRGIK